MELKIGTWTHVDDVTDRDMALIAARTIYTTMRDLSGEGASTFPTGRVKVMRRTYWISYNGRVWADRKFTVEVEVPAKVRKNS